MPFVRSITHKRCALFRDCLGLHYRQNFRINSVSDTFKKGMLNFPDRWFQFLFNSSSHSLNSVLYADFLDISVALQNTFNPVIIYVSLLFILIVIN